LQKLGFYEEYSGVGRPEYSANLLLKLVLYGYFHRIWSYRELEVAVRNHVGAMWLTGMHYPDYTTIGRFIQRNQERIEEVFKACVRKAYEAGLVGLVVHVVDGTKVVAEVSKGKSLLV